MKKLFVLFGFSILLNPIVSCRKDNLITESFQNADVMNTKVPWPLIGVILWLSQGQAKNVEYYPSGNIKKYTCTGIGTCSVKIANPENDEDYSSHEPLYGFDYKLDGFGIIRAEDGVLLLGCKIDNPSKDLFFYDSNKINISLPYVIDNPKMLAQLQLKQPLTIQGDYDVIEDRETNYIYIRIH